jgi:four helix bundle protein
MSGESRYPDVTDERSVAEPSEGPIRSQSFQFSIEIIKLFRALQGRREFVVSKQLLRAGTSIGANVEEAVSAESRRDFLHKMSIALKEARETLYWLRLLDESDLVPGIDVARHLERATGLVRLLVAIVKSTRATT